MKMFSQFNKATSNAMNGHNVVAASISALLRISCPFAIGLLVIAVIVNPVNGHAFGIRPHIFDEIGERISPSVANGNSSAPVVFVLRAGFEVTPLLHASPDVVFSGPFAAVSGFGNGIGCFQPLRTKFVLEAPAGLACSFTQRSLLKFLNRSAIALAEPVSNGLAISQSSRFGLADDSKSCVGNPSCEIYFIRHNDVYALLMFSIGHTATTVARCAHYGKTDNNFNQI